MIHDTIGKPLPAEEQKSSMKVESKPEPAKTATEIKKPIEPVKAEAPKKVETPKVPETQSTPSSSSKDKEKESLDKLMV
jgi:hypothetical protein